MGAGGIEGINVTISEDKTKAFLTYQPKPGQPAIGLDFPAITAQIRDKNRVQNINEPALAEAIELLNNDGKPIENLEIASTGKPMTKGENGRLEWVVDLDPTVTVDTSGNVDFYSCSILKNVQPAQMLARVHKAKPGVDGLSVTGDVIPAPPVTEVAFTAGENVEFNAETSEFFSTASGRVELRGQAVVVSRLFETGGDVDFSVGNIQFDGTVRVRGSIKDNFRVVANDGVQVDGMVEAATIKCGQTLTAMGGINGRERGNIDAGGDVITRFMNNALVYCKGEVRVEKEIMNCKVYADKVSAPNGQVAGGELVGKTQIEVKEAGSQMGVRTILHAGYDYFLAQEVARLQEDLDAKKKRAQELDGKLKAAQPIMAKLSAPKRAGMTAILSRNDDLKMQIQKLEADIDEKKKRVNSNDAQVIIRGNVNPGVSIRIGRYEKTLNQRFEGYRRFRFDKEKYDIVAFFEDEEDGKKGGAAAKKKKK